MRVMADFLDPDTPLPGGDAVLWFWQWAMSSLGEDTTRELFAEYLVATALGCVDDGPRIESDVADIRYEGHLVEVNASINHEPWKLDTPSAVRFDVARKRWWNAETGEYSDEPSRPADAYVFCHFNGAATSDEVVKEENWFFYVVSTSTLDEELGDQKTIGLRRLHGLTTATSLAEIKAVVDVALKD